MSDEYKQVGPDKRGYPFDVAHIADVLAHGAHPVVDVLFAARSTAKHVVLVLLVDTTLMGPRPQGFGGHDHVLFVGIDNGRAAWMPTHWLHWGYVAQYLGQSWGDSEEDHPFADFLNDILVLLGTATKPTAEVGA